MKSIRIVLASPSDLLQERTLITNIIERKDAFCKRSGLTLDLRRWEDTTPGASKTGAQGIIDDDLDIKNADVFICMFWERIGTVIDELGETGTEHELNIALDSFTKYEKPDIKFLLKKSDNKDPKIMEIAKKVQSLALYREFETVADLNDIIDQIITEECNKHKEIEKNKQFSDYGYKEVTIFEDFIDSLGINKTAFFHTGFYNMLNHKINEFAYYEDVFDGMELIIEGLSDFSMIGSHTHLLVEPRYAAVITFRNCVNISIEGFSIGHVPHKGDCIGSVLKFENCTNVFLKNLELFGCGTYGIESSYSNFTIDGCKIFDCSQGALLFDNSNAQISNSEIFDCINIHGSLIQLTNSYLYLKNFCIHDNSVDEGIFLLSNSHIYGEAVTIIHNKCASLGIPRDICFEKDNDNNDPYIATVSSIKNITKEEYIMLKEYLNEKASVFESVFEDGNLFIQFSASSIDIIEQIEEYCKKMAKYLVAYG